ncbi:TRAP transporter substrate-binding protein [Azospirillum brasilense]|uniref:TRAP transporter substrate-binding protein n=1 Tax=Azospirillum brasilense TaxID=192 RepID=UPI0013B43A46|nr:TRAP transporter substrate-binding protein [Azospirillum brasilense]
MRLKGFFFTFTAAAIALASVGHAATPTMKIAHVVPSGDPRDLGAVKVKELLAADTRCSINATVYPSAQLGGTTDLIEGMQIGSVEAVVLPASFMVGFEPRIGIFDFPFFWPTKTEDLLKVHKGPAMAKLLKTTEAQGVVSLGVWHTGYKQWTANKPLKQPSDFAGLKARVMPSPVLVEQQKILGLNPVNMPFPETYNALQNRTIDAQENPLVTTFVMKFHEVQSNVTMSNHGNLDQLFMVSKAWWDGLSAECRTAVSEAVDKAADVVVAKTEEMTGQAMTAFKERGVTVTELSDAEYQTLRETTLPGLEKFYVAKAGAPGREILDGFKSELGLK